MNCSLDLCLLKIVRRLFTLETVVNHFTDRGSPVYVASLDVSKASIGLIILFYLLNR